MSLVLTPLVKTFTFLKGFLITITNVKVDYIKLTLLTRAVVSVVMIL